MLRFAIAVLLIAGTTLSASQPSRDNAFPNTRPDGRATVEYKDGKVKAVAIYDYSQTNHDGAWLLTQIAVSLRERGEITPNNFSLVMPDGRVVPLATHEQFNENVDEILKLRQNAGPFERPIQIYFPESGYPENIRWFVIPAEAPLFEFAMVPAAHAAVVGTLYFKSPTRRWDAGTYRLIFDNEKGRAELPIRLK